jgi:hypothetical protein
MNKANDYKTTNHETVGRWYCATTRRRAPLSTALIALQTGMLLTLTASAQTWQTVDDYQYVPDQTCLNFGLTVAPSGIV